MDAQAEFLRVDDVLTPIGPKSPRPSTVKARKFFADAEGNDAPAAVPPRPKMTRRIDALPSRGRR